MIVAVVDVILITAIATLGAFLYNLAAALLGGLEVTLAEDDTDLSGRRRPGGTGLPAVRPPGRPGFGRPASRWGNLAVGSRPSTRPGAPPRHHDAPPTGL